MAFIIPYVEVHHDEFIKAIKLVLVFHVFVILFQVVYWVLTKQYIDLFNVISGLNSGNYSKKGLIAFGLQVPRFSGFFNEPGTYSITIMSFTFLYYAAIKKIDHVIIFSTLSCLITMSGFGIILVMCFYGILLTTSKNNRKYVLYSTPFIFGLFLYIGGVESLINRFSKDSEYSGVGFREKMLEYFFSDINNFFHGLQIGKMPSYFVPNDLGIWFSFMTSYGVFGLLICLSVVFFVFFKTKKWEFILLVLLLFFTKMKYTYPLFWLIVGLLSVVGKNNEKE
ncbi:hypothetical protein ACPV5I_12280 [Vibrio gigantis]